MNEIKEYSAFIVPSKDGRVIVLARSIKDARLAANAKELYQALSSILNPNNEYQGYIERQAAIELLERIRKDVD